MISHLTSHSIPKVIADKKIPASFRNIPEFVFSAQELKYKVLSINLSQGEKKAILPFSQKDLWNGK